MYVTGVFCPSNCWKVWQNCTADFGCKVAFLFSREPFQSQLFIVRRYLAFRVLCCVLFRSVYRIVRIIIFGTARSLLVSAFAFERPICVIFRSYHVMTAVILYHDDLRYYIALFTTFRRCNHNGHSRVFTACVLLMVVSKLLLQTL